MIRLLMNSPLVSIIIPVKNGETTLGECLTRLRKSSFSLHEIIVVDDNSTDNSAVLAMDMGARVLALEDKTGVSAARNLGAKSARGRILVFTDADVLFNTDTLERLVDCLNDDGVGAAVGVFTEEHPYKNFASQWKNLWMRWTYMRLPDRIALFFTSVAAIRSDWFTASGGFDERYARPSVEDTDLGRRLADLGAHIHLCRKAEVTHAKHYTMWELLRTDFRRASALVKLAMRERTRPRETAGDAAMKKKFSVPALYPIGAFALTAGLLCILLFLIKGNILYFSLALGFCFFAGFTVGSFFSWMGARRGAFFLLPAALFWAADCVAVTAGAFAGVIGFICGFKY
jgi:GT2 family glycosyltransferase